MSMILRFFLIVEGWRFHHWLPRRSTFMAWFDSPFYLGFYPPSDPDHLWHPRWDPRTPTSILRGRMTFRGTKFTNALRRPSLGMNWCGAWWLWLGISSRSLPRSTIHSRKAHWVRVFEENTRWGDIRRARSVVLRVNFVRLFVQLR